MSLVSRSTAEERMDTDCVDFDDYRRCLRDLSRVNVVTLTHRPMLRWLAREAADLDEEVRARLLGDLGEALRALGNGRDHDRPRQPHYPRAAP